MKTIIAIIEFLEKNWVASLFTGITSLLGFAFTKLWKRVSAEVKEQKLLRNGMLAILHDRLFQACTHHLEQGWCTVNEMKNIGKLYKSYSGLGGNSVGTELYLRVCQLPTNRENKNVTKGEKQ